jgi:hypothetical protein
MTRTGAEAKPAWREVPPDVRAGAERVLRSPVARATRVYGGYAPSATFRLVLTDERRAFFKATYPLPEGSQVQWVLDREERVYRRLARWIRPWAPLYIGSVRASGWHAILLEDVGGTSVLPWTPSKARRATRSYAGFHLRSHGRRLPPWLDRTQQDEFSRYWSVIAADHDARERLAHLAGTRRREAARWLDGSLAALVREEAALRRAPEPFVLMHFDTRSDNVRLDGDLLRIFDWPFASVGPHEFDLAAFAQSVSAEGGPLPERVAAWYAELLPLRPRVLRASLAGISGYFADRAPRPPHAGLPRLRSIQRRQLKASLAWAARVIGLPEAGWLAAVAD